MIHPDLIDHAVTGYVETLLWANAYDDMGLPVTDLHISYGIFDLPKEAQENIRRDVTDFCIGNAADMIAYLDQFALPNHIREGAEYFGHDLLLTSSGHGAGFWDRGLGDLGDRLTEASKPYGDPHVTFIPETGELLVD